MAENRRLTFFAAFLAGLISALGQAPASLPWVTLVGLAGIFWVFERTRSSKKAAWTGWLFGLGYFAMALFWIVEPFLVDASRHGWMAPFALVGLAGGMALFWALAFAGANWLDRRGWARAVAFALALSASELLRSYLFTGFPGR